MRHGDDELLVVDEVLDVDVARVEGDLVRTPGSANFSLISPSSVLMTPRSFGLVGQDRLELGDRLAQFGHLLFELRSAEAGEATEGHVEDVRRPAPR